MNIVNRFQGTLLYCQEFWISYERVGMRENSSCLHRQEVIILIVSKSYENSNAQT